MTWLLIRRWPLHRELFQFSVLASQLLEQLRRLAQTIILLDGRRRLLPLTLVNVLLARCLRETFLHQLTER